MAFGPVFRHEMLAAGRKRRFFVAAFGVGLGMLLLMGVCVASASNSASGLSIAEAARLTAAFYAAFTWATLIGVLIATPVVVAGAIASERERRTIEYLFATDLTNAEIVLDKLAARLLTIGKLVLAAVPVLAIFRLMGGVPGRLLLLHFGMIASTALVCAAIALAVSVWCARARDAVSRAGGAVFFWLVSSPIFFAIGSGLMQHPDESVAWWGHSFLIPAAWFWAVGNPVFVLGTAGGIGGRAVGMDAAPEMVGWMIGAHLVGAALLTGVAVMMVRRVHLRAVSASVKAKRGGRRTKRRRGPGEKRPMLWKEMYAASVRTSKRHWLRRVGAVLLVTLIAAPLVTTFLTTERYEYYAQVSFSLASVCGTLTALMAGSRAAGLVCYEHERETWLSLLTTDLSAGEIIHGKLWGNLWAVRWQLFGCLAIVLSGVVVEVRGPSFLSPDSDFSSFYGLRALFSSAIYAAVLVLVTIAATAIGLAVSLRVKSSTKAVGGTIGILLAIGGLYPLVMLIMLAASGTHGSSAYAVLVLPPCAPYLLVLPGVLMAEHIDKQPLVVGLVAGLGFYAFLAFTTTVANVNNFDRLCGRSTVDNLGEIPRRPAAETV